MSDNGVARGECVTEASTFCVRFGADVAPDAAAVAAAAIRLLSNAFVAAAAVAGDCALARNEAFGVEQPLPPVVAAATFLVAVPDVAATAAACRSAPTAAACAYRG